MNLQVNDIIIISLSVIFPLMLFWETELNKKIDIHKDNILYRYINKGALNTEYYYTWLDALVNQRAMVRFLTETITLEPNDPILLPRRSGEEDRRIRYSQRAIGKSFLFKNLLHWGKFIILVTIIALLLFTS